MPLCSVSVDLDEISHYLAIHGISSSDPELSSLVYDRALDRFERFANENDISLTFFVVASDLERPESADKLKKLIAAGHEVGNHSLNHLYDLTKQPLLTQRDEVERATELIEQKIGTRPTGFRAPGYTMTDELMSVLSQCEMRYDSSVFPSPAYYAAKAATLGLMRIGGRRSRSVLDSPKVLRAPTRPYRVGRPYWRRGDGLLELPIQVTRKSRLPFIGTSLALAGPTKSCWLSAAVAGEPLVNIELHGIDLLDESDGLSALAEYQPDLRISASRKFDTFSAVIDVLKSRGHSVVRLDEAAEYFQKNGLPE